MVHILMPLLMFADDMSICIETREGLQTGIDSLYKYCEKWGITVNIDKTKLVVVFLIEKWSFGSI